MGGGGFGEVYRKQLDNRTFCAVKCIKISHKTEAEINSINQYLTKEIVSMSNLLNHKKVIKLIGFLPGQIIMEFAMGGDLSKVIYGNKSLP